MKALNILLFVPFVLFSLNSFALDGNQLSPASDSAFDEFSVEFGLENVEAWQASIKSDEIEVKILSHDHDTHNMSVVTYGCHPHGPSIACHEDGHEDEHVSLKSGEDNFDLTLLGHQTAMAKLEKTLVRQGSSLASLSLTKVWKFAEGSDDGHEHGADVWTKAVYTLNGTEKTTFIQCHQHAGEKKFACHYIRESKVLGEPQIKTDDHDDDHDDHSEHDDHNDEHGEDDNHEEGDDHDHNH